MKIYCYSAVKWCLAVTLVKDAFLISFKSRLKSVLTFFSEFNYLMSFTFYTLLRIDFEFEP